MSLLPARLDAAHAVVTGAGRGLGRACALALAEAGASVSLIARSGDELEGVADEIEATGGRAWARPADVADEEGLEAVLSAAWEEAPIDVLVTGAGVNRTGPTELYAAADFDLLIGVNLRGTFLAARGVGRRMIAAGRGGRIVALSSQMGVVGYPGRAAYCATKHAVNGLVKALAVEWARAGITVNAVAPTFVETPLTAPMFADPDFATDVARRIPGGKIATLEDVAAAVLYLASERARAVTGHVLAVDAGWTAW
ncbi:MAG: SDR family oxidoreductase [Actinobacteria bacterium]|nr:SDR family oxidoreductase [Actinomycetota bacterium]